MHGLGVTVGGQVPVPVPVAVPVVVPGPVPGGGGEGQQAPGQAERHSTADAQHSTAGNTVKQRQRRQLAGAVGGEAQLQAPPRKIAAAGIRGRLFL